MGFRKSSPRPRFAAPGHYVAFDTLAGVGKYEKAEHQYLIHFLGKRSLHLSYEVHLISTAAVYRNPYRITPVAAGKLGGCWSPFV